MSTQNSLTRNCFAFTLIEILIVIGVTAILVMLVLISSQRAIEASKNAACAGHLRHIHRQVILYTQENSGSLPKLYSYRENGSLGAHWAEEMTEKGYFNIQDLSETARKHSPLFCPASTVQHSGSLAWRSGNYALNGNIAGRNGHEESGNRPIAGTTLHSLENPAQTILLYDAGTCAMFHSHASSPKRTVYYLPGANRNQNIAWRELEKQDALEGRHLQKINAMYVDGHIESWNAEDLIEAQHLWRP